MKTQDFNKKIERLVKRAGKQENRLSKEEIKTFFRAVQLTDKQEENLLPTLRESGVKILTANQIAKLEEKKAAREKAEKSKKKAGAKKSTAKKSAKKPAAKKTEKKATKKTEKKATKKSTAKKTETKKATAKKADAKKTTKKKTTKAEPKKTTSKKATKKATDEKKTSKKKGAEEESEEMVEISVADLIEVRHGVFPQIAPVSDGTLVNPGSFHHGFQIGEPAAASADFVVTVRALVQGGQDSVNRSLPVLRHIEDKCSGSCPGALLELLLVPVFLPDRFAVGAEHAVEVPDFDRPDGRTLPLTSQLRSYLGQQPLHRNDRSLAWPGYLAGHRQTSHGEGFIPFSIRRDPLGKRA